MAGQQFSTGSLGGLLSQPYLTQKLRSVAQPMFRFRQFVDVNLQRPFMLIQSKEAIGKNRGDTWLFDKISNVATQGGTLVETNTIPQTNYTINQGTGKIVEYGNSVNIGCRLNSVSCRKVLRAITRNNSNSVMDWRTRICKELSIQLL